MEETLSDKTFVITGATSGIGLSIADKLAGRGAHVIGIGRSAGRCQETESRLVANRWTAAYQKRCQAVEGTKKWMVNAVE